jgi:hypothetical protein
MIAVANDGAVYVTQRRPGSLVMLRDLDGDGIVTFRPSSLLTARGGH